MAGYTNKGQEICQISGAAPAVLTPWGTPIKQYTHYGEVPTRCPLTHKIVTGRGSESEGGSNATCYGSAPYSQPAGGGGDTGGVGIIGLVLFVGVTWAAVSYCDKMITKLAKPATISAQTPSASSFSPTPTSSPAPVVKVPSPPPAAPAAAATAPAAPPKTEAQEKAERVEMMRKTAADMGVKLDDPSQRRVPTKKEIKENRREALEYGLDNARRYRLKAEQAKKANELRQQSEATRFVAPPSSSRSSSAQPNAYRGSGGDAPVSQGGYYFWNGKPMQMSPTEMRKTAPTSRQGGGWPTYMHTPVPPSAAPAYFAAGRVANLG